MKTIAVVDYGMGNLRSVAKALEHVSPESRVVVTGDASVVRAADRVVFPGQGAMPDCMRNLAAHGLDEAVRLAAQTRPFLGVCVGEQMLFDSSEEGSTPGLGIIPGRVVRFEAPAMRAAGLKVPHMGWNRVRQGRAPKAFAATRFSANSAAAGWASCTAPATPGSTASSPSR